MHKITIMSFRMVIFSIWMSGCFMFCVLMFQMEGWVDAALKVFNRHRMEDGSQHPDHISMLNMQEVHTIKLNFIQLPIQTP